jgi:hypothetical protein
MMTNNMTVAVILGAVLKPSFVSVVKGAAGRDVSSGNVWADDGTPVKLDGERRA